MEGKKTMYASKKTPRVETLSLKTASNENTAKVKYAKTSKGKNEVINKAPGLL